MLAQFVGGAFDHGARAGCLMRQFGGPVDRDAAFEHRDVVARILPCEGKVGAPCRLEAGQRRRLTLFIGIAHDVGEDGIALTRGLGDEVLAPGEMAIDGGRGDAGQLGGLR